MRTGADYLQSLDDGRTVMLDGERVDDVTHTPGVRRGDRDDGPSLRRRRRPRPPRPVHVPLAARREPGARAGGRRPLVPDDLTQRRLAIAAWADETCGFLGRSPDHVASFFAGFAGSLPLFAEGGAIVRRQRRPLLREGPRREPVPQLHDHPPDGRSGEAAARAVRAQPLRERVRGARRRHRAARRADARHRFGDERLHLRQLHPAARVRAARTTRSRSSCRTTRPACASTPAGPTPPATRGDPTTRSSTRFDETDSLVVFDDVFVPWEHVFVYRNIELTAAQFNRCAAHSLGNTQAQIRFAVKLRFFAGLARPHRRRQRRRPPIRRRSSGSASWPPSARSPKRSCSPPRPSRHRRRVRRRQPRPRHAVRSDVAAAALMNEVLLRHSARCAAVR